jgi:hypothetical protein
MSVGLRRFVVGFVVCVLAGGAVAQQADAPAEADKDKRIAELAAQVEKLEARLAALEKQLAPLLARAGEGAQPAAQPAAAQAGARQAAQAAVAGEQVPEAQRQRLQAKARQRMQQDAKKYSRDQLREAEQLYQVANSNWRTPQAKQSLEQMVAKFPDVNRTGCAVLYLAQYSRGEEQEKLLKQAIDKYSDCYYGNGVQVGAFAGCCSEATTRRTASRRRPRNCSTRSGRNIPTRSRTGGNQSWRSCRRSDAS